MSEKKYLAVSALDGRDELYLITKSVERRFEELFGDLEREWERHEDAVEWLRINAKYIGVCICVTP